MSHSRKGKRSLVASIAALAVAMVVLASGCTAKSAEVEVPDVTAKSPTEANAALAAVKLVPGAVTLDYSGDTPEGMVFKQEPAEGTMLVEGSAVSYVISKGEPPAPAGTTGAGSTSSGSATSEKKAPPQPSKRVKAMQQELKEAGFYKGSIDGLYGAATAAAIKAAQEKGGIKVDGVYGPETHAVVVSMIAGKAANSEKPAPSEHMRLLQNDLKSLGYYTGDVDALYGPKTEAAVKAFQKDKGLPVTGKIDADTEAALTEAMENFAN